MTARLVYSIEIECDGCEKVVRQSAPTPEGLDQAKYEARLRENGWWVPEGKGVHFCPRCVDLINRHKAEQEAAK